MQPEFPEYVTNPEVVRELIKTKMMDGKYPLFRFPFKLVGYTDDFKNYAKGEICFSGAQTEILSDDLTRSPTESEVKRGLPKETRIENKYFQSDIEGVYLDMSWDIIDELCDEFLSVIKKNAKISEDMKNLVKGFIKWSTLDDELREVRRGLKSGRIKEKDFIKNYDGPMPDPMGNFKDLQDLIRTRDGQRIDVIFINTLDYFDFLHFMDISEMPRGRFYENTIYLEDLKIWLIGIDGEQNIPRGSLLGVCSRFGVPLVTLLSGYDQKFGQDSNNLNYSEENLVKDNFPLNVKIYKNEGENGIIIESWIDFIVDIKDPEGVFYLEDVI